MATSHCSECNRPLPQFWTLDEQRLDALEDFAESKQLNIDTLVRYAISASLDGPELYNLGLALHCE
jgi:hypothetical protein